MRSARRCRTSPRPSMASRMAQSQRRRHTRYQTCRCSRSPVEMHRSRTCSPRRSRRIPLLNPLPASSMCANAAIAAASQTLSVVQYDSVRDEWRTIVAVATVADTTDPAVKRVTADVDAAGNYALIYGDKSAGLARPVALRTGAVLQGVANPCTTTPDTCRMPNGTLTFDKPIVAPAEHSVATLRTDGTAKTFPSGTAVQAYIDELLYLADGSVRIDPPFATDLLLYRDFAG